MTKAFKPKSRLTARDWGNGLIVFSFGTVEDRDWVLWNQLWHFDGYLFVVRVLAGQEQPSSIQINTTSFWVQAYDVPLCVQTEESIRAIASRVGLLECFERPSDLMPLDFLRFKVELDITKPLVKGFNIRSSGTVYWVSIRYESLPMIYCFGCGIVGHFVRNCVDFDRDADFSDLPYGSFIKAPPLRCPKGFSETVACVY
ncbi:hypothetical protein ACS0TY_034614 [Phlomoides rotata]